MNKEFVPYDLAAKLKELGFDKECFGYYENNVFIVHYNSKQEYELLLNCSSPTFSQAFRWFREKYNLDFTIITNYAKVNSKMIKSYRVGIIVVKNNIIDSYFLRPENDKLSFIEFTTYEEAELACLNKLIEIVELKLE